MSIGIDLYRGGTKVGIGDGFGAWDVETKEICDALVHHVVQSVPESVKVEPKYF